ncbi:LOW QUALITY PROTEIN: hypothetical protein Ct61P_13451 [Colletotrichum tofieldiae]|nr:LOW QUALITY PROTEIN: hypothetical protein Ct61P_13451 [Colletotrichum tofieldiae]
MEKAAEATPEVADGVPQGVADEAMEPVLVVVVEGGSGPKKGHVSVASVTTDLVLNSVPRQARPLLWTPLAPCSRVPHTGKFVPLLDMSAPMLLAIYSARSRMKKGEAGDERKPTSTWSSSAVVAMQRGAVGSRQLVYRPPQSHLPVFVQAKALDPAPVHVTVASATRITPPAYTPSFTSGLGLARADNGGRRKVENQPPSVLKYPQVSSSWPRTSVSASESQVSGLEVGFGLGPFTFCLGRSAKRSVGTGSPMPMGFTCAAAVVDDRENPPMASRAG